MGQKGGATRKRRHDEGIAVYVRVKGKLRANYFWIQKKTLTRSLLVSILMRPQLL